MKKLDIEFTRINNDVNGNPRYVCHFLNLNTQAERDMQTAGFSTSYKYSLALARARRIGGRKFHNKSYGGGIVFQCYGAADITPDITRILAEDEALQARPKAYLKEDRQERSNTKRVWFVKAWRVVNENGNDIIQPWPNTRKEAREIAARRGYNLIENA